MSGFALTVLSQLEVLSLPLSPLLLLMLALSLSLEINKLSKKFPEILYFWIAGEG